MHILSVSGVRQCLLQQNKQTYFSLCILMDSANHSFKNSLNENLLPLYFVWQLITNISSISFCGSFSSPLKILAFKEPNSNEFHRLNVWSKKKVLHFFFLVSNSFSISSRRNKEKNHFLFPPSSYLSLRTTFQPHFLQAVESQPIIFSCHSYSFFSYGSHFTCLISLIPFSAFFQGLLSASYT